MTRTLGAEMQFPDHDENGFETILAELLLRRQRGQSLDEEELKRKYPDYADSIVEFLRSDELANAAFEKLREDGPAGRALLSTCGGSAFVPGQFPSVGERASYFGEYQLLEEIGRGGMGIVYKARQKNLNRTVALKMIISGHLASDVEVDRFRREARAAATLQHPNIISIHEIGVHNGHHFFTMDYVEGESLTDRLRKGYLPGMEAARLLESLALAVQHAHEQGVLHRDLKPANILLDESGTPHITDFGLAKLENTEGRETLDELTRSGQIFGTPSYMSPEQAAGKHKLITVATDIYSLGAVLYACVGGRAPFVAESTVETLRQVIHDPPLRVRLLNPRVSKDLENVCQKALSKLPRDRYPTALALAEEARRFQQGRPVLARPIPMLTRVVRWSRRNVAAASLVGLLAFLMVSIPLTAILYARAERIRADREEKLRHLADHEARSAEAARLEMGLALESEKLALAKAAEALHVARWNAYRSSLYPMFQAFKDREFGSLQQMLHTSEQLGNREFFGWEWRFLSKTVDRHFALHEFDTAYQYLQYDSTQQRIAFRCEDGQVDIRNASDLSLLRSLPGQDQQFFDWHPSQPLLAVATGANQLQVWDTDSGTLVAEFQATGQKNIMNQRRGVAWHPSGKIIALGGYQRIDVFAMDGGDSSQLDCLYYAPQLDWHPEGILIAVGGSNGVQVIDTDANQGLWHHFRRRVGVGDVKWDTEGRLLAAAWDYPDYCVTVYDLEGQEQSRLNLKHGVSSIYWDAPSRELLAAGADQQVHWWPIEQDSPRHSTTIHAAVVVCMDVDPVAEIATSLDKSGRVRQFPIHPPPLYDFQLDVPVGNSRVWRCLWHPTNDDLICLQSGNFVHIIDVSLGQIIRSVNSDSGFCVADWHANKSTIAAIEHDGTIRNTDVRSGTEVKSFRASSHSFTATLSWDSTGTQLLVGTGQFPFEENDYTAEVIDVASGSRKFFGSFNRRSVARLSPDAKRVAVHAHEAAKIQVWDLNSGALLSESPPQPGFLEQMAFHPAGRFLALGGDGGILSVWDTQSTEFVRKGNAHAASIRSISWSPDGNRLLTSADDNTLKIWSGETFELIATLDTEMGAAADWSPDGSKIATCTANGKLRVYSSVDSK